MKAEAMVAAGDHSMTVEEAIKFINHPQLPFWTCGHPRSGSTWPFPWQAGGEAHARDFSGPAGASKTMITHSFSQDQA
jgi:hypothetical protein